MPLPTLDPSKFKLPPLDVNKFKKTPAPAGPSVGGSIKTAAQPSLGSEAIKNTAEIYKDAPGVIASDLNKGNDAPTVDTNKNAAVRVGENALAGTARTLETVFAPFSGAAKAVTDSVSKAIESNPDIVNSPVAGKIADFVTSIQSHIQQASDTHPEAARNLGNAFSILLAVLGGGELDKPIPGTPELSLQGAKDTIQGVKDFGAKLPGKVMDAVQGIDKAKETIGDTASKVKEKLTIKPNEAQQVEKISEKTQPKPTAKEAKLATKEGTLVKGKEPGLFKSGTEDTVLPTADQMKANMTIQKQIPGAYKMTEPELYTAMDKKIGAIAKDLTPEMEKTPIKLSTVKKLNTDFEALKTKQLAGVYTKDEIASVKGMQKDFGETIRKFMKGGNMNDVWKAAKEYDASVGDNVKSANSLSSDALQKQRQVWLQNRAVLRSTLTDSKAGLGKAAEQAFSDMHDMYDSQESILSKSKIETKAKPSKLSQFGKSPTGKLIKGAVVGGSIIEGARKLSTGGF